ncbi:hypothetical protein TB2_038439 [Malus domestica]
MKHTSFYRTSNPALSPLKKHINTSQQEHLNGETYKLSLLACKGDYVVLVKEVPFSTSSLNHNNAFILDTASKVFLFSGCNSSIQEGVWRLFLFNTSKRTSIGKQCAVATVEDGKFVGDPEVGELWILFGGYAPVLQDPPPPSVQKQPATPLVIISKRSHIFQPISFNQHETFSKIFSLL